MLMCYKISKYFEKKKKMRTKGNLKKKRSYQIQYDAYNMKTKSKRIKTQNKKSI